MSLLKTLSLEFIAGSLAAVIAEMAAGQIDAIAFTSAPQVRRFRDVARSFGREA
jgi:uroporphyrinogen-III synthase